MKGTETFKQVIKDYLETKAKNDELFAPVYNKPNKNIDDCITYILNQVQKSGMNGFADDEIYSMAIHYYDEDDIKPGKELNCNVVVNHHVELTEEEIKEAKEKAFNQIVAEQKTKIRAKPVIKQTQTEVVQGSLFD